MISVAAPMPAVAQSSAPTESRLLNGLRLLVFKDPAADKITMKLRVHSGAAFDTLGKEGTMLLLSRSLFPNQELTDFFRDDLGGSFSVTTNYDYIEIDASAGSDKLIEMLEPVASGVANPQITKEVTARIKAPAMESARKADADAGYLATIAAAKNLVGNHPYGRPMTGSSASLERIDFADLLQAEERFLTSDNSTLVLTGHIDPAYALKVVKRLFGSWTKSDKKIPATFAQPDAPKQSLLTQELATVSEGSFEVRSAVRVFARSDARYPAYTYLERIIAARLSERYKDKVILARFGSAMPGVTVFGVASADEATARQSPMAILEADITEAEFSKVKSQVDAELARATIADRWLDAETYRLQSPEFESMKLKTVSIVDVQNVLSALRSAPAVTTVFAAPKTSPQK